MTTKGSVPLNFTFETFFPTAWPLTLSSLSLCSMISYSATATWGMESLVSDCWIHTRIVLIVSLYCAGGKLSKTTFNGEEKGKKENHFVLHYLVCWQKKSDKTLSLMEVTGYFATDCNRPSVSLPDFSKKCGSRKLLKNEWTHSNVHGISIILSVVCHLTVLLQVTRQLIWPRQLVQICAFRDQQTNYCT